MYGRLIDRCLVTLMAAAALTTAGCAGEVGDDESPTENVGSAEQALSNGTAAFVLTNNPWASVDSNSYNSSGGAINVTLLEEGRYRVDFANLESVAGGNVQVVAQGSNGPAPGLNRCKVNHWEGGVSVFVFCYDHLGNFRNSQFSAAYFRRTGVTGSEGGYAFADQPTSSSYTPWPAYQWSSTGQAVTVTRTGTGTYDVRFPGQSFTNKFGTVLVTAHGWGSEYCKPRVWSGEIVSVRCFSTTGVPTDAQFTVTYNQKSPLNLPQYTYAWANQPATANYTVPAGWNSGYVGYGQPDHLCNHTAPPSSVRRLGTGLYAVAFNRMGFQHKPSNVMVNAYGSSSDVCKYWSSGSGAGGASIDVQCFTASGVETDSLFVITYSQASPGPC